MKSTGFSKALLVALLASVLGTTSLARAFELKFFPSVRAVSLRASEPSEPSEPLVRANAQEEEYGVGVAGTASPTDLSPAFADQLPYSQTLGKVVCESNFPLESVDGLAAEIERLQRDLVGYLGAPEAREKIELCLFKDKTSYLEFLKTVFPGAPLDRPALYVKDSGPGVLMVVKDERMIVNIRHEMTHAYLNASLRGVPIWLDEGLAKYFEIPPGERGFHNPYLKDVEANAAGLFSRPPSLTRLERLSRVDQMRSREYRESWAWTHFLIHYSPDTHRLLARYLRSLRPGATPEEPEFGGFLGLQKKTPLKSALDRYIPDHNRMYIEHFKNWEKVRANYEDEDQSWR